MGIISSSSSQSGRGVGSANHVANNLPPLLFHQVHGDNIRISRDGSIARRAESFCKGVAFSARPVKINERVYLRFVEVSENWSGVLRFGFTVYDPIALRGGLPKYACPDLTNKPGYWAKALAERLCEKDAILYYYVNSAGDVHFGVNGEDKGIFFSGVDTRGQLWAMLDIYGNSTAVEFLDPRSHLNNARRQASNNSNVDDVDRIIAPMSNMNVSNHHSAPLPASEAEVRSFAEASPPPPLVFQLPSVKFNPLPFHRTKGRNVRCSVDRSIASRLETEFAQGYVFTGRPILLEEKIVVQVLNAEPMYIGALAFGLTSCDPASLNPNDLPDDSNQLLDRPEYWVVKKDVAKGPQRGDELTFCITGDGEVQMSKNGGPPVTLMHVDQSQILWAFFDLYGSTQKIRILGSTVVHSQGSPPPRALVQSNPPPDRLRNVTVATAPCAGGGTVLVVNLPPTTGPSYQSNSSHLATYSPTYIEPIGGLPHSTIDSTEGIREWAENSISPAQSADCSVCYERQIDSVLYTCGHMCMCYECSVQQWRGKGGGHCPLCRAVIRDVIRTFKS